MSRQKFAYKLIFAVGLILFVALVFLAPDIAYAQLPPSYVEKVQDAGLEWWGDLLKLDEVKATVDGWFKSGEMYDFSKLDDDPIVIAVIDSGVDVKHELFSGAYGDGGDADYDVLLRTSDGEVVCRNTVDENADVSDVATAGHGTHVAGIAATLIHRLGLEKYIKIMPIRAGSSSGSGAEFNADDVKEGILFALEHGANVVNLSIEAKNDSFDLVTDEWAKEAIFVAAAGNDSSSLIKYYPAASENVIGVMNISNERDAVGNLQLSASSNYGDSYDLCAPGAAFYSAAKGAPEEYVEKSGTSMAAPVVSFASALALLKFRAVEAATHISKSVEEVKNIVEISYTSQIKKGIYRLNVLDLEKLATADDNVFARVDIASGEQKQRLGAVSPIKLKLDTLFAPTGDIGRVEWTIGDLDGEKIGEGFEFTFTPKNAYGKQIVYARWTFDTEEGALTVITSFSVTVDYAELTEDIIDKLEIVIMGDDGELVKSAVFKQGKEYVLTFVGANNYSPDVTKQIKWYAGDKQIGLGKEVLFKPEVDGKYEIYVSVKNMNSARSVVEFKSNKPLAYVCYALAVVGVLMVAILIIIRAYGYFRAKRKN